MANLDEGFPFHKDELILAIACFRSAISAMVDMPDSTADLLFSRLKQNGGRLSKRARQKEFAALTDDETSQIEQAFADIIVATG